MVLMLTNTVSQLSAVIAVIVLSDTLPFADSRALRTKLPRSMEYLYRIRKPKYYAQTGQLNSFADFVNRLPTFYFCPCRNFGKSYVGAPVKGRRPYPPTENPGYVPRRAILLLFVSWCQGVYRCELHHLALTDFYFRFWFLKWIFIWLTLQFAYKFWFFSQCKKVTPFCRISIRSK